MDKNVKRIRALRKQGSQKLTKLRSDLTDLAWELTGKNASIKDPEIAKTLHLIDESLIEIEKALKDNPRRSIVMNRYDPEFQSTRARARAPPLTRRKHITR